MTAIGTDTPINVRKAPATSARYTERCPAVRAKQILIIDRARASRTTRKRIEFLQEVAVLDFALVALFKRFTRPQEKVYRYSGQETEHDDKSREYLHSHVRTPALDIAKRPHGQRKPQRHSEGGDSGQRKLQYSREGFLDGCSLLPAVSTS